MSTVNISDAVPADERVSSFLIPLEGVKLSDPNDEGARTSWVHAMERSALKHPLWGMINFTAERLQRFADNVNTKVRGVDIAVDYAHNSGGEAAGWIKQAEARADGLWIFVEWTKEAAEKIANKAYRYFSPEFVDEWKDPKTQVAHKDVLLGGGLTNRPFQKGLVPVNLSEFFTGEEEETNEEEEVTLDEFLTQLRTTLKLDETTSAEDVLKKLAQPAEKATSADEIQRLVEENPTVKSLVEEFTATKAALKLSEVNAKMKDWQNGKKYAIPPAVTDELRKILVDAPVTLSEDIDKVFAHLTEHGLVPVEEVGGRTRKRSAEGGESAKVRFDKKVKALMEDDKTLSLAEAISEASRDEELYDEYRQELFESEPVDEGER